MHNLHGSPFYNGTFPKPNTRALPESSTSSIARKGVQRVEDPLAGSRGSAPLGHPTHTVFFSKSSSFALCPAISMKSPGAKTRSSARLM